MSFDKIVLGSEPKYIEVKDIHGNPCRLHVLVYCTDDDNHQYMILETEAGERNIYKYANPQRSELKDITDPVEREYAFSVLKTGIQEGIKEMKRRGQL